MATVSDDRVLTMSRVIKAPPEAVFDAWTKPDILLEWWGPEGTTTPDHAHDVRVGGAWRTRMTGPQGDYVCSGVYRTIDRPRRLSFTWGWVQPDGSRGHETVVDVTFQPVAGGTRMMLVQQSFQDAGQTTAHSQGWGSSFNKLERMFA